MSATPFAAWDITNISNTSKKFLLSRIGISIFFIIMTSSLIKILMWRMRSWLFGRNKKNPWNSRSFKGLELLARFELATSSLPRMRSTDWAIAAYSVHRCPWQLAHYTIWIDICQVEFKNSLDFSGSNYGVIPRACRSVFPRLYAVSLKGPHKAAAFLPRFYSSLLGIRLIQKRIRSCIGPCPRRFTIHFLYTPQFSHKSYSSMCLSI